MESKDVPEAIQKGEEIEIDFAKGELKCKAGTCTFLPPPKEVLGIVENGGLIPHVKKELGLK